MIYLLTLLSINIRAIFNKERGKFTLMRFGLMFLLFERKISPGNLVKRNFPRNVYTDGKGIYLSGEIVNQLLRTEHILKQFFVREI